MKLFEILTPPPTELIVEGYTFTKDDEGHYTLDYDASKPGEDDKIMAKHMSGLRSKQAYGRSKLERARDVNMGNFDVFSRREREEFAPHYDESTFNQIIPVFYGLSLDPGKARTQEREHYRRILDALKGRDNHSTTPEAMEQMMHTAARSAIKQIKTYYREIERTDHLAIIPVPSSSTIPEEFAQVVADELGAEGKVVSVNDILEQNLKFKVGVAGGKETNPDNLENLYMHVLDGYQAGNRSEDDILDFIEQTRKFLERQLNNPSTDERDVALYKADLNFLDQMETMLYDNVDRGIEPDEAHQLRVHDVRAGLRRHLYDRVKLKKGAKPPKRTNKTIYVLVDDNVDQGRTVIDVYRYLYKAGLFNQPNTKVIGIVMHKLGADNKR